MGQPDVTPQSIATRASNWLSTALSIPMIWPKTTALVSLAVIALSVTVSVAPLARSDKPPPPNDARLAGMLKAVEERDQAVRSRTDVPLERNPEMRGVFEMIRNPPESPEELP